MTDTPASPSLAVSRLGPTVYQAPAVHPRLVVCPECSAPLVRASACVTCTQCGWGRCG